MPAVGERSKVTHSTVTDDAIARAISPALRVGLGQLGERAVMELMEKLSVPVEYDGNKVIRSKAGDPPRMEEDMLRQSADSNVVAGNPLPYLHVSLGPRPGGDPDAAEVLEFGGVSSWGDVAARPSVTPQMQDTAKYAIQEVSDGIRRAMPAVK